MSDIIKLTMEQIYLTVCTDVPGGRGEVTEKCKIKTIKTILTLSAKN